MTLRVALLADLQSRRAHGVREALARHRVPSAGELDWRAFLEHPDSLNAILDSETLLRIESPDESYAIARSLQLLGGAETPAPHQSAQGLRAGHLGLSRALEHISERLTRSGARAHNPPETIGLLFHKARCQAVLEAAGVATPPRLFETLESFDALTRAMDTARVHQVFIKPHHGSSASGCIAYRRAPRRGSVAYTTLELGEDGELYNSLKVLRLRDDAEIRARVERMCQEGVMVERWLPKASLDGASFDVRVVVLHGKAAHATLRLSTSPFTNLHLGNRRGDVALLKARVRDAGWSRVERLAERAVAVAAPSAQVVGVDVLIGSGWGEPVVLELNAFGDLLPGMVWDGEDTYGAWARGLV